jgi:hypothetical protein
MALLNIESVESACRIAGSKILAAEPSGRAPNKPLQRSGLDKVLGRGRGEAVLEQVMCARVLKRGWPVAEWSR